MQICKQNSKFAANLVQVCYKFAPKISKTERKIYVYFLKFIVNFKLGNFIVFFPYYNSKNVEKSKHPEIGQRNNFLMISDYK